MGKKIITIGTMLLSISMLVGCSKTEQWEKTIVQETVEIEGLSKEYDFLFLTDTHMVVLVLAGHVHFSDKDRINDHILQLVGAAGYKGCAMHIHLTGK